MLRLLYNRFLFNLFYGIYKFVTISITLRAHHFSMYFWEVKDQTGKHPIIQWIIVKNVLACGDNVRMYVCVCVYVIRDVCVYLSGCMCVCVCNKMKI